jgi:ABC-2 type transport system permease protein
LAAYVRLAFLQWLAWRAFALTLMVNQAITPLIGLAVWTAALPGRTEISTYYVGLLLVQLLTVSYEYHTFSNRIYGGELADDLLRPHAVVLRPLGENVALRLWHLLLALPLLAVLPLLVRVDVSGERLGLAVPAVLLAGMLRFLFTYTLALSALWTDRAGGVVGVGESLVFLLGGGAAPLALMPGSLRILGVGLPFRSMYGFPAEVGAGWLGPADVTAGYGWQLAWLGFLALLAALVWRAGVRRYTAVGG